MATMILNRDDGTLKPYSAAKTDNELMLTIFEAEDMQRKLKEAIKKWQAEEEKARADLLQSMLESGVIKQEIGYHIVMVSERDGGLDVTDDMDAIPPMFIRTKTIREPDKIAIRKYLKSNAYQGTNWAKMREPVPTITIRVKE